MRNFLALFFLCLFSACCARSNIACSFDLPNTTWEQYVDSQAAIFTGKVLDINEEKREVEFEVFWYWKGNLNARASLFAYTGNCNYVFVRGEKYIVFASGNKYLSTYIFDSTEKLAKAGKTIQALDNMLPIQLPNQT